MTEGNSVRGCAQPIRIDRRVARMIPNARNQSTFMA
jgi:hypothetical protein